MKVRKMNDTDGLRTRWQLNALDCDVRHLRPVRLYRIGIYETDPAEHHEGINRDLTASKPRLVLFVPQPPNQKPKCIKVNKED